MLYKEINKMIASAMKEHNKELLEVYKLIKAELVKAEKDGVEMNDINETKILLKMASQREDSIRQYIDGGRKDLADREQYELDILSGFIPKQPTEEEIADYTSAMVTAYVMTQGDNYKISMKDMKPILSMVQEKYPSVNGKIVSQTLNKIINS